MSHFMSYLVNSRAHVHLKSLQHDPQGLERKMKDHNNGKITKAIKTYFSTIIYKEKTVAGLDSTSYMNKVCHI